jgi:hypothetical protein
MKTQIQIPDEIKALFTDAEVNLTKKLQKINESVKEALALTDLNIMEKALVAPSLHHGFINCLFAERAILTKLEKKKEQVKKEYLERYGQMDIPKYQIQGEIDKLDDMKKLEEAIDMQKEVIRYLEEVCKILSGFGFSIKNSVDLLKISQ